ncbi:carboxymuconolactone decarboxylase family protein [Alkalihalophilus pseudofirmus]|uniref:Carboxymuconolactone decarboxylase family protein n=1 Tax=Alkalihalophilus pseudofirmus TaxID=79885 RepID=A0AAJ2NKY6_ALKPS|nr:carboxymuconolactone decarboxylase family protein [Alkalihalophilus pseudofirmus]MDV2884811.1 carboxymuconolactone decarboxylase family protein [Alkalihalophilus pseudofirmus]
MARILESKTGRTPFQRLLGHNPEVMNAWSQLGSVLEGEGNLSAELKEQVRRTLAQGNGCEYCKAKGKPDDIHYDEKTSVAVAVAEVFLTQKGVITDQQFHIIIEAFTQKEISELFAFITFTTASQYFGAAMRLEG